LPFGKAEITLAFEDDGPKVMGQEIKTKCTAVNALALEQTIL
jgi:hypothetical protein